MISRTGTWMGSSKASGEGASGVTYIDPLTVSPTAWYDPSDLSTLWKDTGGTDPVTADGDAVARMDDKSGNGRHVTQSTALNRPLYKTGGGLHWLDFDGSNDVLTSSALISTIISVAAHEAIIGAHYDAITTTGPDNNPELNTAIISQTTGYLLMAMGQQSAGPVYKIGHGNRDSADAQYKSLLQTYTVNTPFVWTERNVSGGNLFVALNGNAETNMSFANCFNLGGTFQIGNGYTPGFSRHANAKFYGAVIKNAALSTDDRTALRVYMAAKAGVTL